MEENIGQSVKNLMFSTSQLLTISRSKNARKKSELNDFINDL